MEEYLCLTLLARPGEDEGAFAARLTSFWTHLLRNHPETYEYVYAEATRFGREKERATRQYMVHVDGAGDVRKELEAADIATAPVDEDDLYSKYEATSPDWFQLDH